MNIILIGSTGTLGTAIYSNLESKGHTLVTASRSSENSIDIDNSESIKEYFAQIISVDAIICTAGSASFGSLEKLSEDQIELGLKSKLLGQINIVKEGISKLNPGGVIILTGGMLAHSPWPETSNIATVNAGLEGFVKAVALELTDDRRIVVVHPPLISETAETMRMDSSPWPTATMVSQSYVKALDDKLTGKPIFVDGYHPA